MSSPHSLRGLYHDPASAWSFNDPILDSNTAANSSTSSPSSYSWSAHPPTNSVFELAPSFSDANGLDPTVLFKAVIASSVLQYTSTAIAMPWEVAKLLLQVQWVPRDGPQTEEATEMVEEVEVEESSDSENDDSYFADPTSSNATPRRYPAPKPVDEQGYVVRKSVLEDGTRPEYTIPVGSTDGVWGMIKRVGRFRGEGWLALWKGLLTSTVTDLLSTTLQPIVESALYSFYAPQPAFRMPPISLPITSHVLIGLLLSPLDLVRTRLIVQSFNAKHQTYSGPLDALSQILRDEGGLRGVYTHPHLFLPALFDCALRPLVALAVPRILASTFNIYEDSSHPIIWGMAQLAGGFAGLLITLPFETVRRRLQVQTRGTARKIRTCVETRPVPYNGMVDCFWRILTEERSDLPITKGKDGEELESGSWLRHTGIGQLYRGFGMRLSASAIVFLLQLLKGTEEVDSGWAEL